MISDKFKNPKTPYSGASCNNIASDTCDPKQNALSTFPAVRRWSISILLLVAICAQTMPTHAMPTAKSLVEQTGSSESGQTPSAPSSDYRIFIPQASKNTPSQALGAGAQIIEAAGKVDVTMELKEPESQPHPEVVLPPLNTSGTVKCDPMHYTGDEVYNTVDQFILNPNVGLIYPGSIVQSRDLMQGVFTPVTIPTGSGEITLSGPVFSGNNSSRDVPTIDYRHTYGAIQDILKDTVVGTPAEIKTVLKTASSKEEMFFEAGLDARYSQFSAAGNVMSKNTNSRSQAFLMYVQSYYDVSIKDPERSFSFFRDGGNFTDPDGQIRSGNPPMYVQSVTYGRVFILSVESDYDDSSLLAALNVAWTGGSAAISVTANLTAGHVIENSNVLYFAFGGSADAAVKPIGQDGNIFENVKQVIADAKQANYSNENPGKPIKYTVRYLLDKSPARVSYNTAFDKKTCKLITTLSPPPPPCDDANWVCKGEGTLPMIEPADIVTYTIKHNAVDAGIRFRLVNNTPGGWWKKLVIPITPSDIQSNKKTIEIEAKGQNSSNEINVPLKGQNPVPDIILNTDKQLEFWKGGFLGFAKNAQMVSFLSDLKDGDLIEFHWLRD